LAEHAARFTCELLEFCPSSASPVTESPRIVPLAPRAPRVHRWQRPALRYHDQVSSVRAWQTIANLVNDARPDVILAHPCRYQTAPTALRWTAAPSVYFCHEPRRVDYERGLSGTRNSLTALPYWPLHRAQRREDRAAVARASAIVTNSAFTAAAIEHAYGRTATPISLGVPSGFQPSGESAKPRHLLSVGALTAAKGHALVLDAAARARVRWPVVIVAPRADAVEAERLAQLAAQQDIDLTIRVGIPDDELVVLYQHAVATMYLASAEPFGLASIEAQACGCPVIVADEGGLPETVVHASTGWRVPRRPEDAARRLDDLEDSIRRQAMVARATDHGRAYTWDRSTDEMEGVLERFARRGATRRQGTKLGDRS
jgi:glycosyltransferase involved in cell wall biosynthesis